MNITLHSELFGTLNLHLYEEKQGEISGYAEVPETVINGIAVKGTQRFGAYATSQGFGKPDGRSPLALTNCYIRRVEGRDEMTANQRSKVVEDLRQALKTALAAIPNFEEQWDASRFAASIEKKQAEIANKENEISKLKQEILELEANLGIILS